MKRGDRVVTSGGIYGTIVKIRNEIVHLEIADQVRIRVNKSSIADVIGEGDKMLEEVEEQTKA